MDGVHLGGEQLQSPAEVPLFSKEVVYGRHTFLVFVFQCPNKMFCFVKKPKGCVAGRIRPKGYQVLKVFETRSKMGPSVLFQLVVTRS